MTISNNNRIDQFKLDCKIINLKYEYPSYKGNTSWAIVSELTERELLEKYPEEIKKYIPFVWLSSVQGEVFVESERNSHKHKTRASRYLDAYGYDDDIGIYHSELVIDSFEEEREREVDARKLKKAIQKLKSKQRERIIKLFYEGKNSRQIAKEDGISYSAVDKSISNALSNLRVFLSEEGDINE